MFNIRWTIIKQLLLIVLTLGVVTACSYNINSCVARGKYYQYIGQISEYINRIGKRLLIVSEEANINKLNINFIFKNTHKLLLNINSHHNSVVISKGLLEHLQDEAELAAILALSIVILEQEYFNKHQDNQHIDEQIINYIYKAGYDPMAFVELQEEYLVNKDNTYNWLKSIFLYNSYNIAKNTVDINKNFALYLTKGTERAKERYFSQIKTILKRLD